MDNGDRIVDTFDLPHVLLADDEQGVRDLVAARLELAGFRVVTATDGVEALEKAMLYLPIAIVIDDQMPGLCGSEVCVRLAFTPETAHIPIIFVTGFGLIKTPGDNVRHVIAKPFRVDEIVRVVTEVTRSSSAA